MATATDHLTRPTTPRSRATLVAFAVVGALALNLLIYVVGRACGVTFTYTQSAKPTNVDAVAVTVLSVIPLTIGLTLVALLARRWPALIAPAKVVAAVLAVGTIGLMTIPAGFGVTSALFLATMHLTLGAAAVLALGALAPRR